MSYQPEFNEIIIGSKSDVTRDSLLEFCEDATDVYIEVYLVTEEPC